MRELKESENFNEVLKENKVVLVDFSATWCGPCKKLTPMLELLSEEFRKAGKSVLILKVDVDNFQSISQDHNISCLPTMILYINGKLTEYRFESLPKKIDNIKDIIEKNL
jgi:thioredoxin 1